MASRTPAETHWKCSKTADSVAGDLVNVGNLVNLVNLMNLVGSAKLELRFADVQRLDAMVKCGWWDSELRGSS